MLFKAMGDEGGFVALGGMISTTAAIERRKGSIWRSRPTPR